MNAASVFLACARSVHWEMGAAIPKQVQACIVVSAPFIQQVTHCRLQPVPQNPSFTLKFPGRVRLSGRARPRDAW